MGTVLMRDWYCQLCMRMRRQAGHLLQMDVYGTRVRVCDDCAVNTKPSVPEYPRVILTRNRRGDTLVNGRVKPHLGCE